MAEGDCASRTAAKTRLGIGDAARWSGGAFVVVERGGVVVVVVVVVVQRPAWCSGPGVAVDPPCHSQVTLAQNLPPAPSPRT